MAPFEWIAVVYFAGCGVAGGRSAHRLRGTAWTLTAIALVIVARFTAPWEVRAWLPHLYLVLGYWIPAVFTPRPTNTRFEEWLRHADAGLFGRWMLRSAPCPAVLETAYLLCYPLVPAAFLVVFLGGAHEDVTRFWVGVLLAGYACYGTLPWTAARPPRLLGRPEGRPLHQEEGRPRHQEEDRPLLSRGVAAFNVALLGRVSHNQNTFPSGHVAVSIAAGVVVWPVSAAAGAAILIVAAAIAVAAVAGRYHFGVDVLAGVGVGAAAAAAAIAVAAAAGPGRCSAGPAAREFRPPGTASCGCSRTHSPRQSSAAHLRTC